MAIYLVIQSGPKVSHYAEKGLKVKEIYGPRGSQGEVIVPVTEKDEE